MKRKKPAAITGLTSLEALILAKKYRARVSFGTVVMVEVLRATKGVGSSLVVAGTGNTFLEAMLDAANREGWSL